MAMDSPTNNDVFQAYVRNILDPSLHPGDIVVLDNLRSHKIPGFVETFRNIGADVLYLPPYLPI